MGMNGIMIRVFLGLFLCNIVVVLFLCNIVVVLLGNDAAHLSYFIYKENYRKIDSYLFETLSVDFYWPYYPLDLKQQMMKNPVQFL